MRHGRLPSGLVLQRATDTFSAETVPTGLLRAHRLAAGVWGVVSVSAGSVAFVWEGRPDAPIDLSAGDTLVIEPEVPHRVVPAADARFTVAFHR